MPKNVLKEVQALKQKYKGKKNKFKVPFPDLRCREEAYSLSNTIQGDGGFKRNKLLDHRWRKGMEEKPETVAATKEKAGRIRPLYGKGNYQYSTDGDNSGPLTIYRK